MKKLILFVSLFAFMQAAKAQVAKGTFIATGTVSYSVTSDKRDNSPLKQKYTTYSISPQFGYLISENLEIGLSPLYKHTATQIDRAASLNADLYMSHEDLKNVRKGISAYVKKYMFLTDRLAVTGTGEIGYFTSDDSSYRMEIRGLDAPSISINSYSGSNAIVDIRPGLSYFLTEKINLSASFGMLGFQLFESETTAKQTDDRAGEYDLNYTSDAKLLHLDLSSTSSSFGLSYLF